VAFVSWTDWLYWCHCSIMAFLVCCKIQVAVTPCNYIDTP